MALALNIIGELDRAFHDSWPTAAGPSAPVELFAARGAHVGLQLVVAADGPVRIETTDPRAPKGRGHLPAPATFHTRFVPLEQNSKYGDAYLPEGVFDMATLDPGPKGLRQVVRRAPCEIAEVLVPARSGIKEAQRPVVLFVDYDIPRDARPGRYSHSLRIRSGRQEISVPVDLDVYAATVPEKRRLKVTNWFDTDEIARCHRVEKWSEPFWALLRKYAKLMVAHGQTMFWMKPDVFDLKVKGGKVLIDWQRFERYVRLFLAAGFTQIEGPHLSHRYSGEDAITHMTWAWGKRRYDLGPIPTSVESHALLRQWLTPLWDLLRARGWDSIYYQHVFDEPLPTQADHYRHLALIVRQLMPGVRLMDAVHIHELNGAVDVMVPSYLGGVRRERRFAEAYQRCGVEVWYYTCCCPRGRWLNRFLDFPLIRTRLMHWYNYITHTTGYLHWGLNHYRGMDPWQQTVIDPETHPDTDGVVVTPPGDTHVVWPGDNAAYGSLRLSAMRNGIEDYELLAMLREDPARVERADAIADSVIRNGTSYIQDSAVFNRHHRDLLELASG